ncbi:MAG: carboxypeptidase regulatory-like domain-containing protein, partial [Bryobacteraceae bacterium]
SYSFTVSQRLPWSSLLEVAYVGNQSNDLQNTSGAGSNVNLVPVGAMLGQVNPSTANANNFRPYLGYGDINLATNNLYANYNAMQVTWARQKGRFILQLNYSYQKALGIVNAALDPFDLSQNYGIQPGDRRQLFNASYSFDMGNPFHGGNRIARGAVNGWQLSGITSWESGSNLTYNSGTGDHYNIQLNSAIIPGSISAANPKGIFIGNQSLLGTNAIQFNPTLTCNPTANLAPHQYINGNCFAVPTQIGSNGPTLLPAAYGPAFFNSDLGLFKNFKIGESKKLQFRIQAYNFLNHPLWSFPNSNNLTLQFQQPVPGGPITQTNSNFGTTTFKQGNRIVELAVKFYF